MAENKKSFLIYTDWGATFDDLTEEEAGRLAKHLFDYVRDKDPKSDKLTEIAFSQMKQDLKRNLKTWESIKEKRSQAGKKSAQSRAKKKQKSTKSTKSTSVKSVEQKSTNPTVNDNVNDNDNVNVINNIDDKKSSLHTDMKNYFISFVKERFDVDYYWTAKDAKNLNLLIKKIKNSIAKKNMVEGEIPDKMVLDSFLLIVPAIDDQFILDNFEIPMINSQYNKIILKIKQPKNGKWTDTSAESDYSHLVKS